MSDFRTEVIREITKPRGRDKQKRVGPSSLGLDCERCLGRALLGETAPQDFSLYPWLGTAGHYYLEDHTFQDQEHELKLMVGEVDGYGEIWGTTDMWYEPQKMVVDWKFVGLKNLKKYRVKGVSNQYRFQAMLYARGAELLGKGPERIAIVFIPRDSGDVKDIWVHEEEYQPEMAEAALERAGHLYKHVMQHGWEDLESDDDCWTCRMAEW